MTVVASVLDLVTGLPGAIAFVVVALLALRSVTVVRGYERYVVTDGDEVGTVLEPGIQVTSPIGRGNERVDIRTQTLDLPVETARTSDGVDVAVEVSQEIRVTDAAAAVTETDDYRLPPGSDVDDYQATVSERTHEIVVDNVECRRWDELVDGEAEFAADCERQLAPALEEFGVQLVAFDVAAIEESA